MKSIRVLVALALLHTCTEARPMNSKYNIRRFKRSSWFTSAPKQTTSSRILLVPGITASQLSARIKPASWYEFCPNDSPKVIWIGKFWCLSYLELQYNAADNTYFDQKGVTTFAPGFGDTSTIECLADSSAFCLLETFLYFRDFVDYFEGKGYRRKVDIRAAPYDWRYAADMHDRGTNNYFDKVKSLIEEMYNGQGITLVGHSMGGLMSMYFLNEKVTQAWKDKYIKAFVPIAVPFGGATGVLYTWLTGKMSIDLPEDVEEFFQRLSKSLESSYWLLPRPDIFGSQVILETPARSYTSNDYEQFFTDAGESIGWTKYKPTLEINKNLDNPNVTMYCIYGTDRNTDGKIHSNNDFEASSVRTDKEQGDGSVNLISLEVCKRFTSNVCTRQGSEAGHAAIVKSEKTFQTVESIANGQYACFN